MASGLGSILYPVKDVAHAKALYSTLLGMEPHSDAPYYVGFRVGDLEIGLVPNGHDQGMTGPVGYFAVDDINQRLEQLVAAGATVQQQPRNVGGGRLVALVKDADGNDVGLIQDTQ